LDTPSILRLRCAERTSERSLLAGRKRERLVRECASAKCAIPKCDAKSGSLRATRFFSAAWSAGCMSASDRAMV